MTNGVEFDSIELMETIQASFDYMRLEACMSVSVKCIWEIPVEIVLLHLSVESAS